MLKENLYIFSLLIKQVIFLTYHTG